MDLKNLTSRLKNTFQLYKKLDHTKMDFPHYSLIPNFCTFAALAKEVG